MRYKFTDEDIEFLKENYPKGNWDVIKERFPLCSKSSIHHKMSRLGISFEKKRDLSNFDYISKKRWTKEEDEILQEMYSYYPIEDVMSFLPSRSKASIILRANKMNIPSFSSLQSSWKDYEDQYIIDNWETTSDEMMSKHLDRIRRSVKWRRELLGLYRIDFESNSYTDLAHYLRGNNQEWKNESMKQCHYQCVLTGSKNFEIHHLYGVSNILKEIVREYGKIKESFSDYNDEELSFILSIFLKKQAEHPLGVCLDKEIHKLFHSIYGRGFNTPNQWYQFEKEYKEGAYNNI